ncbi:hypothetical protein JCM8208_001315 [Rhodotorula glutinis]
MPTSLLSLPDELLVVVVDHALGEYAPRLYQERQDTCRALSLVNKRVGAVAQDKLVEVVHASAFTPLNFSPQLNLEQVTRPNRVRALWLDGVGPDSPAHGFLSFAAVRDLRLTNFHGVRLRDLGQLPELRTLLLSQGRLASSKPLSAPRLERLVLYFCEQEQAAGDAEGFTAAGCPSLRHLYLGVSNDGRPWPCAQDLIDQVDTLGSVLMDRGRVNLSCGALVVPTAALDKVLFDLDCDEFEPHVLRQPVPRVRHLRVYGDSAAEASYWVELADGLVYFFPSLATLCLPRACDAAQFTLGPPLLNAMRRLTAECERTRVAVVFEHAAGTNGPGELCAAPHFEARCRRIKAERATSASRSTRSGATAGR